MLARSRRNIKSIMGTNESDIPMTIKGSPPAEFTDLNHGIRTTPHDEDRLSQNATEAKIFPTCEAQDQNRLVCAEELLRMLWTAESRPSIRWLRKQQSRRAIPFLKLGARVWFCPAEVRRHLDQKWKVKQK